jgi:hypothetical protein
MSLTVIEINHLRPALQRYTVADWRGPFLEITPNDQ